MKRTLIDIFLYILFYILLESHNYKGIFINIINNS